VLRVEAKKKINQEKFKDKTKGIKKKKDQNTKIELKRMMTEINIKKIVMDKIEITNQPRRV